ncbi:hypothetical protein CR513_61915, partial [Mucuna pruriens]
MLHEVREATHIREYAVKARVAKKYNKRVVPRSFKPQDLVLRQITQKAEGNKLTPIWEGPFRVTEEVRRGAYRLESLGGKKIPHNNTPEADPGLDSDKSKNGWLEKVDLGLNSDKSKNGRPEKADPGLDSDKSKYGRSEQADPGLDSDKSKYGRPEKADPGLTMISFSAYSAYYNH